MPEIHTLMTGLAFGESPRWHTDRLWFSDFGAQEVGAVDLEGKSEVIARIPGTPMGLGFLPDGRLLIVSMRDGQLLRREHDGSLVAHADLSHLSRYPWSDMVVDGWATLTLVTSASTSLAASSPPASWFWSHLMASRDL
jgi:sugar lactone lactonase YvrE